MSLTSKRFLAGLVNRVKNNTAESRATSKRREHELTARRLTMEALEERQLLAVDPSLLQLASQAQVASQNVNDEAIDLSAIVAQTSASSNATITVDQASFEEMTLVQETNFTANVSNAVATTTSSHMVVADFAAQLTITTDQMAWAATLADLLAYTGWSQVSIVDATSDKSPEEQTFDYFTESFTNDQSSMLYAYGWFMGGANEYIYQGQTNWAQIYADNTNGGLFPAGTGEWSEYTEYASEILAADIPSPLYGISTMFLDNNYGVGMEIHLADNLNEDVVNATTNIPVKTWGAYWGYDYDATYDATDKEYYTAVYMSNADTGEVERLPIEWDNSLNAYVFKTLSPTTNYRPYIYSFTVIQRMPGYGVLEPDAYEPNNSADDFENETIADLGKIDEIVPSASSGATVYGNTFTLDNLTLYAEGSEDGAVAADPVDYYKFELGQTASNSDSIVVKYAEGYLNDPLKVTLYVCGDDGTPYVVDAADYGFVEGHFNSVASQIVEHTADADGKIYSQVYNLQTITLAGLTAGTYYLKVEFADGVVSGVNQKYSVTFNAGYDDLYESNNSFEEVKAAPVTSDAAPTSNFGVLFGEVMISDLVLRQYSDKIDEVDWYRFEMSEKGSSANFIKLYYNSTSSQVNDADLDLYLYREDDSDPRGYKLVAKSYAEMTDVETIDLADVDAGVYYIKVVGNYSAGNVEYKLQINPGVSDVPDVRMEVPTTYNWEAPLVVSGEKYVANSSETYVNDAIVGIDTSVYLNFGFSVYGASKETGASETAVYKGVKLGLYINGVLVDSADLDEMISANTSLSATTRDKLYDLFCGDGVDMYANEKFIISNLNLGRIVDTDSFAAKYFDATAQAPNSIVLVVNPDNYTPGEKFGVVEDHQETKQIVLKYDAASKAFYNGSVLTNIGKGETFEVYRNGSLIATVKNTGYDYVFVGNTVINGVRYKDGASFTFVDGDYALVSVVEHQYAVNLDYTVKPDVEGVLEYVVDNNMAATYFIVNSLSEDDFAPNGSIADILENENDDATHPDLGVANIENLTGYTGDDGGVYFRRQIDNLVITGEKDTNDAYISDWFKFSLKTSEEDQTPNYENAYIEIDIDDTYAALDDSENLGDLDLYLYKFVPKDPTVSFEEAYESGAYNIVLIDSSKGVGDTERINFADNNMEDGTYFICVSGFNGSSNRYSLILDGFTQSGDIEPSDPSAYFTDDAITILNSIATVNIDVPSSDYVSQVTLQYRVSGEDGWTTAGTYKPSVKTVKIAGLQSDTKYEFRLTVSNYFVQDDPLTATVVKQTETFLNEVVYRAVIVGVADYPGTSGDLVAAANDAKAFYNELLEDPQWAEENITLLTNTNATRAAVLNALQEIAQVSDDNDVLVFYFAGSGASAITGGRQVGYLKTYGSIRSEYLSSVDLLSAVESIAAGSKQFILDGSQISNTAEATSMNYTPFITALTGSTVNGSSDIVAQTTVLTACEDGVVSPVGQGSRSVFNRALIDAMETYRTVVTEEEVEEDDTLEISDGRVTFTEILSAVNSNDRMVAFDLLATVTSNDPDGDTVIMNGEWNEDDAYAQKWLDAGAIVVTTSVDTVDAHDGKISLREAANLIGTILNKTTRLEDGATFTLAAGSQITIGTTSGELVDDVELVYQNGSFRTAGACSLQTTTRTVDFSRAGNVVSWSSDVWEDGYVTLADENDVKVQDVTYVLLAQTSTPILDDANVVIGYETTSVELEEGDVLTTAETGGRELIVTKVGQNYRLVMDGVVVTRTSGLYLDGVAVTIATTVDVDQNVEMAKILFEDSVADKVFKLDTSAGPIDFANGGVVDATSLKGGLLIDGQGASSLIKASGANLVTIIGAKLTNASGAVAVVESGASLEIANSLIYGNAGGVDGVFANEGDLSFVNATIVNNTADGNLVEGSGTTSVVNTIISLNTAATANLTIDDTNVVSTADIGFTDAANGDYTLLKTSAAIDIGQNSAVKLHSGVVLTLDLAGEERIGIASTVDAGCYEYTVALADRETPSTVVTILEDIVDATDDEISLREAIAYAGTTYEVETTLEEGDILTTDDGTEVEVRFGRLMTFDGVSAIQNGQYYAIEGVYLLDEYGEPTLLEEGDVVTLANGSSATVVGTRLQYASGIPVAAGATITTAKGVTGTLSYGAVTNFTRNQQIRVALTAAIIDPSTPVGTFDAGTYTLTYQQNGTFSATLNVTTTDESNNSTTSTFDANFKLIADTKFNFLDSDGQVAEEGIIATQRTVELEDGKYSLVTPITETIGRQTVTLYATGAQFTLERGVFTDADGNVVTLAKGTELISPTGATVVFQSVNYSNASLQAGDNLTDSTGKTMQYKEGLTLYEEITLGTTITFKPGLQAGTVVLEKGDISVERAITLDATLNSGLTIDAQDASRVFTIDTYRETNTNAYVTLNGLTLVNGADDQGGFIYVESGSNVRVSDTTMTGSGAQKSTMGGAIYNAGRIVVESNNKPTTISAVSADYGGAIYNVGNLTVTAATISDVQATDGAGVYNTGVATLAGVTIANAVATGDGGAIYNSGTLSLTKKSSLSGSAVNGGAVYNAGQFTVVNADLVNSTATNGAGIYNAAGKTSLTSATIMGNVASQFGGAIYDAAQFFVTRTVIAENDAASNGSGVYTTGSGSIVSSLLVANGQNTNSTGKYVVYVQGGELTLTGDDVVGNTQAGVYVNSGSLNLFNTIVGDNNGYDLNYTNSTVDAQYSMVERARQSLGSTNLDYEPNFYSFDKSQIADWQTAWNLRLNTSSPAVGGGSTSYNWYTNMSGNKTTLTVDFAGNSRVTESGVDVGAYSSTVTTEAGSNVVTTLNDTMDPYDGLTSLREAIRYASNGKTVADRTVVFSPSLFAVSNQGTITLDKELQTIIISSNVVITSEYTDEFGKTSYYDITIDGSDAKVPLFKFDSKADVEIRGMTLANGSATGDNQNGGAMIIEGGSVSLLDCVVTGNTAERNGGAVYQTDGVFFAVDSLFYDNNAGSTRGYGGAICVLGGQSYIYNSTIASNGAGVYGGVFSSDGLVVLANSIVAQNRGAQNVDVFATNLEATSNLIGVMDSWRSVAGFNGNIVGAPLTPVDPLFTDVANGDFTLASGSLAINAGVNSYAYGPDGVRLKFDLNSNERIIGGVVDMGAFESGFQDVPSTVVTTLNDVQDQTDGLVSLREAIEYAQQLGTPITFDLGEDFEGDADIYLDATLGAIDVTSKLVIDATSLPEGLTIHGDSDRIFYVHRSGSVLENGSVTTEDGALTLKNVALTEGMATRGAAIYMDGGSLDLTNVLIYNNSATDEGGAIYATAGSIVMLNTTVAGNEANNYAGVYTNGSLTLQNSVVAENASENSGSDYNYDLAVGGKMTSVASVVGSAEDSIAAQFNGVNGNTFGTTEAFVDAGFTAPQSYDFTLLQDSIAVNAGSNRLIGMPGYYASILQTVSNPTVVNVDYAGNPRLVGGTVDIGAYEYQEETEAPAVVVTTLDDIVDPFDGKISLREAIDYAGSSYYLNGATTRVGRTITFDPTLANGVITLTETLEITKCVTIDASNLAGSITLDAGRDGFNAVTINGQADSVSDTITICGLGITGGEADYGAGVYHVNGKVNLINCVVYANEGVYGAGIASVAQADVTSSEEDANSLNLINCTVANNNATGGYAGLWSIGGPVSVINSIIAKNTVNGEVGQDVSVSNLAKLQSSLIGVATNSFARAYNESFGNFVGTAAEPVDPSFTNLETNDLSLGRDADGVVSIAVNAGDNTLVTLPDGSIPATDAANNLRIIGSMVDMGAYESQLGPTEIPSLLVTTLNDVVDEYDGLISLREAVAYANNYGLASTITFAPRLTGQTLVLDSSLILSNDVTIDGLTNGVQGLTLTLSDDVDDQSIIYVNSGSSVINGLTITNRYTERYRAGGETSVEQGGAIYVRAGSLSIYNSLITDNAAQSGSAIYVNEDSDSATVTLCNCTVIANVGQSSDENQGAAIYSERGVVNLWNTIVASNNLENGDSAQDVYKGRVQTIEENVVERSSVTLSVDQYGGEAYQFTDGQTFYWNWSNVTYSEGAFYLYYGTDYQYEANFVNGDTVNLPSQRTLTYQTNGWFAEGVAYEPTLSNGDTALWTSVETGETTTVYYNNGTFRTGSYNGTAVVFTEGDSLTVDVSTSYAYNDGSFYRVNVTYARTGWFGRREYVLSQEAQVEYAQMALANLQNQLQYRTTFTKTVNGVDVVYEIADASVEIIGYSAEVTASNDGYTVDYSYTASYTFSARSGLTVLHSYIEKSDTLAALTSGNGSFIGSSTNDLSGETERMFVDLENADYNLTDDSLATNAGDNTYFNQGTINGTFDSLDILGNPRIYYTTVDMGAYENQNAKDSPVTGVYGSTVQITVTTAADVVDSSDGFTSLREALATANTLASRGYNNINIVFDNKYTIHVDSSQGSLTVDAPVTIYAEGSTIDCDQSGCGLIVSTDGEVAINNLIITNGVAAQGSGIKLLDGDLILANCLIYNCESTVSGAVYTESTGVLRIYNSTIAKNIAVEGSGVYGATGSNVLLYNTIVAQNNSSTIGETVTDVSLNGSYSLYNTLVGSAGTATAAAKLRASSSNSKIGYGVDNAIDPLFVNSTNGNFHVSATSSPAKNAGSTAYIYGTYPQDLDGNLLTGAALISMGAYQIGTEAMSTVVTTLDDVVDSTDGLISLREAIAYAAQLGDNVYGASIGSVDNSAYNATNAMNNASAYSATYYHPITFDPSLAGGTIVLTSTLNFNQTWSGRWNNQIFDYMIDGSSISGLGGITIDASNVEAEGMFGGGAIFSIGGSADTTNGLYWPGLLDVRNVKIVGNQTQTCFSAGLYSILSLRNTLVEGFRTAVTVRDNDSDQAGVAHIYNSTIIGGISVSGPVYLYNSIVTGNVNINYTDANPGYRYCYAYTSYVYTYSGRTARFSPDAGTITGGTPADLFVNAAGGDYRLGDGSLCTNMGNNTYVLTLAPTHADAEVDANGNLRIIGNAVDMGCYERAGVIDTPSTTVTTELDVVDPTDGLISLREALIYAEQASNQLGNTVRFSAELDGTTIVLDSPITLARNVRFDGAGYDITLDANGTGPVFNISIDQTYNDINANVPNVYLSNLTLTGGKNNSSGGAINITAGNVSLTNLEIFGNEASKYGGAIYAYDSELTITNCRIGGNTAAYYGGVVNEFGRTVLNNSYVAENVGLIANAGADIWGKSVVNYVNSKNNVVGYVADNITLYNDVNGNRVGTAETPIKPFVNAAAGNLDVLPEYAIAEGAVLDDVFDSYDELEENLDIEFAVLDDDFFGFDEF
ncbi:MAG: choice-of-anchor Q domain-containing protein [Planctomycetia bacterium]|nr:choice-of-anchor Q domain-containing protein [Planctomycetia bacterium]